MTRAERLGRRQTYDQRPSPAKNLREPAHEHVERQLLGLQDNKLEEPATALGVLPLAPENRRHRHTGPGRAGHSPYRAVAPTRRTTTDRQHLMLDRYVAVRHVPDHRPEQGNAPSVHLVRHEQWV